MVAEAVGYDAAKQIRRKRLTVDTLGLVLRVFVSAANVGERKGAKRVLKRVKRMGKAVSRVHTVWVDGAMAPVPDLGHGRLPLDCPSRITTGADQRLCLAQKVVERTFGWLMGSRRLVRDYELLPQTSETFIYLAIRLMVKRLA